MSARASFRFTLAIILPMILGLETAAVFAQTYPNRPITYIVPYGPGSGVDVVARIAAEGVTKIWGHTVVVNNMPGASGNIGMEAAAKAAPDGYTIVIGSASEIINQFTFKSRFNILKDYAPIALTGSSPLALAVTPKLPVKSVDELVALAKSKPGKLNYAAVIGTTPHLVAEMLKTARHIDIVLVPYKTSTDAITDVISGRVQAIFTTLATALPLDKEKNVKVLVVTGDARAALLPNVPTLSEVGLPSVDVGPGFFVLAPANTPRPIIDTLNAQFAKAMKSREVIKRLSAVGVVAPKNSSPELVKSLLHSEVERWRQVVAAAGLNAK